MSEILPNVVVCFFCFNAADDHANFNGAHWSASSKCAYAAMNICALPHFPLFIQNWIARLHCFTIWNCVYRALITYENDWNCFHFRFWFRRNKLRVCRLPYCRVSSRFGKPVVAFSILQIIAFACKLNSDHPKSKYAMITTDEHMDFDSE